MTVIEPGSRWVAKDGSHEVVVEYWPVWSSRGDVRNVANGRVFHISQPTLVAKYRPVEQGADQLTRDEREDKLPAWARKLLADERKRADVAERKLAEQLETVAQTPIWYGMFDNPIYVSDDRISYALSDGRLGQIDVALHRFRNASVKPFLRVSAHGGIRVNPRSTNGIDIYMEDQ